MRQTLGRAITVTLRVTVVAVLLVIVAAPIVARARGWRWVTVMSASMAPDIPIGSVVLIRPTRGDTVNIGDVVAFTDPTSPERQVLHRVRSRFGDGAHLALETKGDANTMPDSFPVPAGLVFGTLVGSAPPTWLIRAPSMALSATALAMLAIGERPRRSRRRHREPSGTGPPLPLSEQGQGGTVHDLLDVPELTTDLDRARADLDRLGFCRIEGALATDEVAPLRHRTVEQAAAELDAGVGYLDTGGANQRIWNLLNKGDEFQDLVVRPLALEMMRHLLGERFLLSSLTANIAGPGGTPMVLHQDEGFIPFPQPAYPLVANIAWLLDDVTDANGGTRFVPGSHLWDTPLTGLTDPPTSTVAAEGPAGTAVVFDGRIWHGTGANRTDAKRHVLLAYYCRPFVRQQENPFLSMSPEVEARLSPAVRRLLGYKIWGTLGGVECPHTAGPDGFVRRAETPIGRLP